MTRFAVSAALSCLFVTALGGVFAVAAALAMPHPRPATPYVAATQQVNFCEWEWAGPVTGWVRTDCGCATGETCSPPVNNGAFIGDIKLTDCVAAPAVTVVPQRMPACE